MLAKSSLFPLLIFVFVSFYSCKSDSSSYQNTSYVEHLDVFGMRSAEDGFAPGNLLYGERIHFNQNDDRIKVEYLNADRSLKGTERYIFEDSPNATESIYSAPDATVLSKYLFNYDEKNHVKDKYCYDAEQNLLRIEEYEYNDKGFRTKKRIYNSLKELERTYIFEYDAYGNETMFSVYDKENKLLNQEQYKITEYDTKKRWVKKTGFTNEQPRSFKVRRFE